MSEEKGLLTKALEELVIEGLDNMIKEKGITELASDMAIKLFVPVIDNNIADKIKDSIKIPIREAGQLIIDKEYDLAIEKLVVAINDLVDIPGVSEELEEAIARKQLEVFVLLIQAVLENKKN